MNLPDPGINPDLLHCRRILYQPSLSELPVSYATSRQLSVLHVVMYMFPRWVHLLNVGATVRKEPSATLLKIEVSVYIWKTIISFSRENFW